jgi:hypothetical protein
LAAVTTRNMHIAFPASRCPHPSGEYRDGSCIRPLNIRLKRPSVRPANGPLARWPDRKSLHRGVRHCHRLGRHRHRRICCLAASWGGPSHGRADGGVAFIRQPSEPNGNAGHARSARSPILVGPPPRQDRHRDRCNDRAGRSPVATRPTTVGRHGADRPLPCQGTIMAL